MGCRNVPKQEMPLFSPEELRRFEVRLLALDREIGEQLRLSAETARPVSLDTAIGRITRMDAIQHQQMALYTKQRLGLRLSGIRAALDRVRRGSFGVCAVCGDEIPRQRLEAVPESPLCVECLRESDG